ncbi:MAG: ParB N-terminal domain-containing protein [Alphaproteobacteria bacterium]|nr:ParB N-terminal domain-containing protein [Alphaproteobacteria bacterium]
MIEQKQGLDRPMKRRMAINAITTNTGLFQFRTDELTNYHVDALKDAIGRGNELDALDVWEDPKSGKLIVIDGHHRLAAYLKAGHKQKIAVLIHRCTQKQARLLALEGNAKTRLPMTPEERYEAAWTLDSEGGYSKAEITKYTGVGDGTVAAMRRAMKQFKDAGDEVPTSWYEAKMLMKGWETFAGSV